MEVRRTHPRSAPLARGGTTLVAALTRPAAVGTGLPIDGAIFEEAVVGMALVRLDGRVARANSSLCELLDRHPSELIGQRLATLTHPDDREASARQSRAVVEGSVDQAVFEERYLRPDGSIVVAEVTSAIVTMDGERMLFSQLRDVTEEHATFSALCESERRFRGIAEASTGTVFWYRSDPDPTIVYVSPSSSELCGYAPDEIYAAGADWLQHIVHPDDRAVVDMLRDPLRDGGGARVRLLCRDGSTIWVEVHVTVLRGDHGSDHVGVIHDVTGQVKVEEARVRSDSQQRAVTVLANLCLTTHDPDRILSAAVDALARHASGDMVAVWWEVAPGGDLRLADGRGFQSLEVGRTIVDGTSSHPACVRRVDDVHVLSVAQPGSDLDREGVAAGIGVPIRVGAGVEGVLAIYAREADGCDSTDVTFLQALAATLGACRDRTLFHEALVAAALRDETTGLPNRAYMVQHLDHELAAAGADETLTLLLCGLDDFKLLNEARGLRFGDRVLAEVAARLTRIAGGGVVARMGGDEFAIVFRARRRPQRAGDLARRVTEAMREPFDVDGIASSVTVSLGFAVATPGVSAGDLLASCLAALHRAKSRGKGQWQLSSATEQADALRRVELTTALGEAIAAGEVRAHFQPIVCLERAEIVGYEALARWERPDGTMVMPDQFIPIAEETGLIDSLGLTMLDQACEFLASLGQEGIKVTVNVAASQLADRSFPGRVDRVLARHDVERSAVCLELTESALVSNDADMTQRLDGLKSLGVSLAIDDFGTGYSSFAYLTDFPVDILKLDRSFVTGLPDDPRRRAVASALIDLARTLEITVVAEGVETVDERAVLESLGCELGQGYLWSRPVPAAAAAALLG